EDWQIGRRGPAHRALQDVPVQLQGSEKDRFPRPDTDVLLRENTSGRGQKILLGTLGGEGLRSGWRFSRGRPLRDQGGNLSPNIGRPLRDCSRLASSWMTSQCSASTPSSMRTMSATTHATGPKPLNRP